MRGSREQGARGENRTRVAYEIKQERNIPRGLDQRGRAGLQLANARLNSVVFVESVEASVANKRDLRKSNSEKVAGGMGDPSLGSCGMRCSQRKSRLFTRWALCEIKNTDSLRFTRIETVIPREPLDWGNRFQLCSCRGTGQITSCHGLDAAWALEWLAAIGRPFWLSIT